MTRNPRRVFGAGGGRDAQLRGREDAREGSGVEAGRGRRFGVEADDVEELRDGRRFAEAAQRLTKAGKHVVAVKGGRSRSVRCS